ncbi:MAG: CHAT domain-containing protein [Bacteroidales bacterium]|nr:CHAT domain-containing protein [Bacteroidales bacterium]
MNNRNKILCNILIIKFIIGIAILFISSSPVSSQINNELVLAQQLYDSSRYYNTVGNTDYAIQLLHSTLNLKQQTNQDFPPEYFKVYNQLGVVYKGKGNLNEAIDYYGKALINTKDEFNQAVINGNIANVYALKGDYLKAISYLEIALLSLQQSDNQSRFYRIVQNYHNQGYAYKKIGNYQLAIQKYIESIRMAKENGIQENGNTYYNCGRVYEKLDSLDKAKDFLLKAVNINTRFYGKDNLVTIMSNMNLANFYTNKNQFDKASEIYSNAYSNLIKSVGIKHPFMSFYYKHTGDMYNKMEEYHLALKNYQQSLISKVHGFNDTSLLSNPSQKAIPDMDLLNILKDKSNVLVKLSNLENREVNLKAALSTLELTVGFIEQLRMGYLYEDSKLVLAEKEYETYMSIIKIAYELLNITGNKDYINLAFKYSERSKYAILRESINEESARNIASIPENIQKQEEDIKEQIGNIRIQIETDNKLVNPDSSKQIKLKEKLFRLTQSQEKIIGEFEQNYPKYYKQKYENKVVDIVELQQNLLEKEAVISYEITDSTLYTFLITKNDYNLSGVKIDSSFYLSLNTYIECLHSNYFYNADNFKLSYDLYKVLIEPIIPFIKGKNLLIIPNNDLSLMSFESLAVKLYSKNDDLTKLYLIKDFPIGYAFSATLFVDSKQKKKKWNPRFLGFAPDYKNSRDQFEYLPSVSKNLRKIAWITLGKIFTKEKATEYNLKKHAKNYDIIHLYVHGDENLENPRLSKMYLSYKDDTIEDGYLYASEIDELELNSELIVLASCFSGSGQLSKGEGVLSIGRNFINSGNKSIVMSLWLAYYEASLFELKEFYKYLVIGKRKDEAMRMAKLNYLETANLLDADPKYWSSIVVYGNQEPIYKGFFAKIIIGFCIIILLVLSTTFLFWKKFKSKR